MDPCVFCWKSAWDFFFRHLCAFSSQPSTEQPLPRALCVQSSVVQDSFELLLSYLGPKATATFTNQVLPRLSPPWSLRGKAGAAGRPQKGCRGGRKAGRILPFSFHGSPGIRRGSLTSNPLHTCSSRACLCHWGAARD